MAKTAKKQTAAQKIEVKGSIVFLGDWLRA